MTTLNSTVERFRTLLIMSAYHTWWPWKSAWQEWCTAHRSRAWNSSDPEVGEQARNNCILSNDFTTCIVHMHNNSTICCQAASQLSIPYMYDNSTTDTQRHHNAQNKPMISLRYIQFREQSKLLTRGAGYDLRTVAFGLRPQATVPKWFPASYIHALNHKSSEDDNVSMPYLVKQQHNLLSSGFTTFHTLHVWQQYNWHPAASQCAK
jgi:hypothetical protein